MRTRCPACNVLFNVQKAQLLQADGLVRCGQCEHIFNGYERLEVKIAKNTEPQNPETVKRMLLGKKYRHPAITALSALTIMIAGFAIVLQLAYFERARLLQQPALRHTVNAICARLTFCAIPAKRDLQKIQLQSRNVYSHPNLEQSLIVNAVINNAADFSQPYPILQVSMSNIRGQVIAERYFQPNEYLPDTEHKKLFAPGATTAIHLELVDPGQNALAFELDFL